MEAWVEGIGTLVTPVGAAVAATVQTGRRRRRLVRPASDHGRHRVRGDRAHGRARHSRRCPTAPRSRRTCCAPDGRRRCRLSSFGRPTAATPARPTRRTPWPSSKRATRSSSRTAEAGTGRTARPVPRRGRRRRGDHRLASRPALVQWPGGHARRVVRRGPVARRRSRPQALAAFAPYVTAADYHEVGRTRAGRSSWASPCAGRSARSGRASRRPGRLRLDGGGAPAEGLPGHRRAVSPSAADRHR